MPSIGRIIFNKGIVITTLAKVKGFSEYSFDAIEFEILYVSSLLDVGFSTPFSHFFLERSLELR